MPKDDKKALRYAARLTAIYDWYRGEDDRTVENLSKDRCLEAVRALSFVQDKGVTNLWDQASSEFPHIGNTDIKAVEKWILPEVCRVYNMQRREIRACERLSAVYEAEGTPLKEIQNRSGEAYWRFAGWLNYTVRMPWLVVLAVESLDASKTPWKTFDVYAERDRLRRSFNENITGA